ncbi:hypothetical protein TTHERM_00221080 (macronuclear) [Tetrahymena thermophila SB210]|uniref:Uncharacterized protein n=1 Tax=Tetrahymena thermophila (strain SB210) TaxID=312017 RepID=I7MKW4_TETTS|nr:hypothetical protein TTHERM_00221080 [Tetrahymena thermophila SB210]EAS00435.1 hypothetical protein TTHERM_00221080 [Tetrahymena thermophila SB210]|eukprot:XP_001020680.1 hypothetical protein TTHERM_00221080 [Tetrahymena thermophila SB210]
MITNVAKKIRLQLGRTYKQNSLALIQQNKCFFGIFDMFSRKKFQQSQEDSQRQYEENLKKSEEARKKREGETIIIQDEKFDEEQKKKLEDEVFDPEKFTTKENYIRMLQKDREKEENERELSKETIQEFEKRKQREYEVEVSQVDFAKIAAQNINIRPVDTFQHPEELFYFVSNLSVSLTEENLKACLEGFLSLAERINEADIESSTFQKFLKILLSNMKTIGDVQNLLLVAKFGDLYCITDPKFWEILEMKVTKKLELISVNDLVEILEHFSHQKEGTEYFFDKIEMVFQNRLNEISINQLARISQSYFSVERGTKEFFNQVQEEIEKKVHLGSAQDLLKISKVYKNSKRKDNLFMLLEQSLMKYLDEFDFYTTCQAASGFGFMLGSMELYRKLEIKVQIYLAQNLENLTFEEFKLILDGFLHTYRGSQSLFKLLRQKFIVYLPQMTTIEAAQIVKAIHLVEFDDKEIYKLYEERIIYQLQGVDEITLEEIAEISKSYTLTRNGSRKLYKLLEIVITHRWQEIAKDHKVMKELYVYFSKSGLCSERLMTLMEKFNIINN